MATIFVDDGGSNTSPYETWAKAATTLQTALTAWTTSDVIIIGHDHNETINTALTAVNDAVNAYIPIYSCDSAAGGSTTNYLKASTVQINHTTGDFAPNIYAVAHGVYFDLNGTDIEPNATSNLVLIDCVVHDCLAFGDTIDSRQPHTKNCSFTGTSALYFRGAGAVHIGASVSSTIWGSGVVDPAGIGIQFYGGDVSTTANELINWSGVDVEPFRAHFYGTKLHSSPEYTEGVYDNHLCAAATFSGGDSYYAHASSRGLTETDTGIYYDSGWLDVEDSQRLSYKMTAGADTETHEPVESGWLEGPHISTSGPKTITIQAWENHATALQDDEAWIEILYPATATSPALTGFATTQTYTGVQTQADLTAGVGLASWTGETGGVSVQFAKAVTFANAGPFLWRVCLGKYESGKQLNFDILPVIT